MAWKYVDFHAGRPKVGLGGAIAAPPPIPGCKPDENPIFPDPQNEHFRGISGHFEHKITSFRHDGVV